MVANCRVFWKCGGGLRWCGSENQTVRLQRAKSDPHQVKNLERLDDSNVVEFTGMDCNRKVIGDVG